MPARPATAKKLEAQKKPPSHAVLISFPADEWQRLVALREQGIVVGSWIRARISEELDKWLARAEP